MVKKNIHTNQQFQCNNETDLHCSVVKFFKKKYPGIIFIVGLGELQDTPSKRISSYKKGYRGGQPDLWILHPSDDFSGMAIEFKNPNRSGRLSSNQDNFCNDLQEKCNFNVLISNDYDEIILSIYDYLS